MQVPNTPVTAITVHIHIGTEISVSSADQTVSFTESAESMARRTRQQYHPQATQPLVQCAQSLFSAGTLGDVVLSK